MGHPSRRRLTREQSQEQTRRRLIESARRQVATRGFNAATVRDIAEDAGYSLGAFYSNFDSKESLLLEVLSLHRSEEALRVASIIDSAGGDFSKVLAGIETWAEQLSKTPKHAMLALELQLQAVRDPNFGAAYSAAMAKQLALYADLARRLFDLSGATPPAPLEDIASGLMALSHGVSLDRALGVGTGSSVLPVFFRALFQKHPAGHARAAKPVARIEPPQHRRSS
ncbi:AcrR family transcriptional regulator [Bradyrhizobium sp. USDA 4524]|uniref:TetR/AcrR family transcriptional regulator n=1 Tax=unclassified Bradyrhizobium TaxID=2631580 RepID=UPI0020A0BBB3|nr:MULTISPECIES: TetR/AcrR family transcriptional regulator [unclassified Bradyrhizobium]MCP1845699.1 AcrR family transcriptional regulator [Bradyrhizobium sp. USDA 4538]MCP1846055.1 AcrR family transcriptional regulator [Bradyrhizobium sp. USDA 4538]MCP1906977.1 AcrR family transcriptional regulator [Bradyrhizobium sp. USDA 4537]MCP1907311.1 AcrR family transcriptional regulator [Bradyrhizobium sp. USDA 4537]MCP1985453.1 AcrR family transcriptional regulator [Bradyrhizobium sp. USDA 4539]